MTKATKDKSGKSTYFVPVTGRCRRNMLRQDIQQFKAERYLREAAKRKRLKKIINVPKQGTWLNTFTSKIKSLLSPARLFNKRAAK